MALTVLETISESPTTSVHRAHDDTLGRDVLLKVLHRHLAHDEQVRERFVREARACAALRSENIVQVFDLREHDGSPAIMMEFVNGRSLKDVIAEGDQRTYAFAEKVAVHVLRGLVTAHAQGIIHRDIKPGNILVSKSGTIMITDFGLAQITVAPTLTTEGMIVGTPAYFAPEVIRGETADARTDLFSLGATLAEVLTGQRLFEGATYSECLNRIALFKPEMLDPLVPVSSAEFVAFLKKLMHPNRHLRFATPKEALAALGKLSSSQFSHPLPRRMSSPIRRRFTLTAFASAVVSLLGIYLFMRLSASEPTVTPPNAAMDPERSVGDSSLSPSVQKSARPGDVESERPLHIERPPISVEATAWKPDSGMVTISGTAGTKVHIDNQLMGESPFTSPVRLAAGTHTIVFTHSSFEPIVRSVSVEGGKVTPVAVDFFENAGYLRCMASPWAEVSVDDLYRDTTPFDRPIALTAGTHRIRFHHPAFPDSVKDITIAAKETLTVNLTFKR